MAIEFIPDGDPAIDDVRRARFKISEMCGHDIKRLVAYYIQRQEQHRDRLVSYAVPATTRATGQLDEDSECCPSTLESAVTEKP